MSFNVAQDRLDEILRNRAGRALDGGVYTQDRDPSGLPTTPIFLPVPRPAQPLAQAARRVAWRFCRAGDAGRVGSPFGFLQNGDRRVKTLRRFARASFNIDEAYALRSGRNARKDKIVKRFLIKEIRTFATRERIVTILVKSDHLEFHITNTGTCGRIASVLDLCLLQIERTRLAAPQKLCAKRDPNKTGWGQYECDGDP